MKAGRRSKVDRVAAPQGAGRVLARLRKERGIAPAELARALGWSESTLARVERPNQPRALSATELEKALAVLAVSPVTFDAWVKAENAPRTGAVIEWLEVPLLPDSQPISPANVLAAFGVKPATVLLAAESPEAIPRPRRTDGKDMARRLRKLWGLGTRSGVADLSLLFGTHSILLLRADVRRPGAGFLRLAGVDAEKQLVVVPVDMTSDQQRWTAAEMLGLLNWRAGGPGAKSTKRSQFMGAFAREFLLPADFVDLLFTRLARRTGSSNALAAAARVVADVFGAPLEQVWRVAVEQLEKAGHSPPMDVPPPSAEELAAAAFDPWWRILRSAEPFAAFPSKGAKR